VLVIVVCVVKTEQNGVVLKAEPSEVDTSLGLVETEVSEVPCQIEDTHQKYMEMFSRDSCHSDDDDDNDNVDSESG